MANQFPYGPTISQLPAATAASRSGIVPVTQGGLTYGVTIAQISDAIDLQTTSVTNYGAVADCQKVTTNVSMAVGSNVLNVSSPIFAATDVGKIIGVARQDCYGGFCPWYGSTTNGYAAVARITGYNSQTQVTLSVTGSAAPTGLGITWPSQSWPYNNVSSIVMWGTDNSTAFQTALSLGGDVYVPPAPSGGYAFSTGLVIPSNTTLFSYGRNTNLMPLGCLEGALYNANYVTTFGQVHVFIANTAYAQSLATITNAGGISWGQVPSYQTTYGDVNITIRGLSIDMSMSGANFGQNSVRFYLVKNLVVTGNVLTGSVNACYEAPVVLACSNYDITFNRYNTACTSMFGPWDGHTDGRFCFNSATLPYNSQSNVTTLSQYTGIEINAVGNITTEDQPVARITIMFNEIFLNGSNVASYGSTGIVLLPFGSSAISDCTVAYNNIYCSGSHNFPVTIEGGCEGIDFSHNKIIGADGITQAPVVIGGGGIVNSTAPTSVTSPGAGNVLTIAWASHNLNPSAISTASAYIQILNGPTVAGVALNNYYLITAATTSVLTIYTPTATSGAATVSWSSSFQGIYQFPTNITLSENQLIDCASLNSLIELNNGSMITVENNKAQFTLPNATPSYVAFIQSSGLNAPAKPVYIKGNEFPTGTGAIPSGYAGNNRICWNPYQTLPYIVDTNDVDKYFQVSGALVLPNGTNPAPLWAYEEGTWTPLLQFGGNSVGMTYTTQQGLYRRIGSMFWISVVIVINSVGSSTGNATIAGIYGAALGGVPGVFLVNAYAGLPSVTNTPIVTLAANTILLQTAPAVIGGSALTNSNFANGAYLEFSGWFVGSST